jgi:hypothetical protein
VWWPEELLGEVEARRRSCTRRRKGVASGEVQSGSGRIVRISGPEYVVRPGCITVAKDAAWTRDPLIDLYCLIHQGVLNQR